MACDSDYIAVDWGTTNRRAVLVDRDGTVHARSHDGESAWSAERSAYPRRIEELRAHFGARVVVAAGMVGSARGWIETPYIPAPVGIDDLAAHLVRAAPDVWLVPGVAIDSGVRRDVMRGEEVQVLGAIAAGLAPATGRFCHPGTHNKWVRTENGRIVAFTTAMTGELFALLRAHGTLADMLTGEVSVDEHFRAGVDRGAGARDLAAALFGIRAAILLGALPREAGAAVCSGLLIGADVGARDDVAGSDVHVVGDSALAALYAAAIGHAGGRAVMVDAEAAFVAGIHAITERLQ